MDKVRKKGQIEFLDASGHLYTRVCPSVGQSVRPSLSPLVGQSVRVTIGKITYREAEGALSCPAGLVLAKVDQNWPQ